MSINRIMKNAIQANWALVDDFQTIYINKNRPLTTPNNGMTPQDILDIAIINIDLPQLGSDTESVMQGGEWRIYNAKFQPFSFSITFRDFGGLDLRNYFSAVWMDAQRGYYDDVTSTVKISLAGTSVFESEDCLITAVSQVQLSNDNSQIAEFTVEFTSPYYSNAQIKNFGSDAYRGAGGAITGVTGIDGVDKTIGVINDLTGKDSILNSVRNIVSNVSSNF